MGQQIVWATSRKRRACTAARVSARPVVVPARDDLVIDDFCRNDLISTLGTPWRGFSDQVMGGVSRETMVLTETDGRRSLRLTGDVRLENKRRFHSDGAGFGDRGAATRCLILRGGAIGRARQRRKLWRAFADAGLPSPGAVLSGWFCCCA